MTTSSTSSFSQSWYETTETPTKKLTELIDNITFAPKRPVIKRTPLRFRANCNNNIHDDINRTPQRLGKRLQEDEHMTWAPKKSRNLQNTPEKKIELNVDQLLMAPRAPRPPKRLIPKRDITWAPKRPVIHIRRFPPREITA